ncbi:MAG: hypothetical protein V2B18_22510 [Pseudomonadota bacterium]
MNVAEVDRELIKRDWTLVFFGCGTEYVLHPLYEHMVLREYDCTEIDTLHCDPFPLFDAVRRKRRRVALISSQHFIDGRFNRELFGKKTYVCLMEAAGALSAEFTCFFPHDLIYPITTEEIPYLAFIDLYLAAEPRELFLKQYCDVKLVGWMKAKGLETQKSFDLRNDAIWLFCGASTLCAAQGVLTGCDQIAQSVLDQCSVKIASWYDSAEIEQRLRDRGLHVIDSSENAISLIRHAKTVVSNGVSSVVREANLFGKRTVVVVDDRITLPDDKGNWWQLAELPNVEFCSSLSQVDLTKAPVAAGRDLSLAKEVSLEQVAEIIVSKMAEKAALQRLG